jgi:hypothetical protein
MFPDALEDGAKDVDVVVDREAEEEPRERVVHLLREENGNHDAVGEETEAT